MLSFCSINRLYHRLDVCNATVAVGINTGETFSISHPYDVILGRDWFELCSTDSPEAAVRLSSLLDQWLVFAASPENLNPHCLLVSSTFFTVIIL